MEMPCFGLIKLRDFSSRKRLELEYSLIRVAVDNGNFGMIHWISHPSSKKLSYRPIAPIAIISGLFHSLSAQKAVLLGSYKKQTDSDFLMSVTVNYFLRLTFPDFLSIFRLTGVRKTLFKQGLPSH